MPRPLLPLTNPTVHDMLDAVQTMITQAGYSEKVHVFTGADTVYTYDNETVILVDTSVPRTIRLRKTAGHRNRVSIRDASGNGAHVNNISILAFDSVATPEFNGGIFKITQLRGEVSLVSDGDRWFVANNGGGYPGGRVFPAMLLFPETLDYPVTIANGKTGLAMDYTPTGIGSVTIQSGGLLVQA